MSTAGKRPQLSADELHRLNWLLGGALALISLWTVFFLDVEALALTGVAGAAIVAVMVWPALPGKMPVLVWRLAVPGIIAAVGYDFYSTPETLPVLIRLAILLVLYRAVTYRRRREDLQLIVLGLFLIVVAGVLTVSLGFAVLLLVFTGCALAFLFGVTLSDITGAGTVAAAAPIGTPAWVRLSWRPLFVRLRQVTDWRLVGLAVALFAGVVVVSGLLFLVIPRFEIATGFFLDRYITRKSRTGFSETVRFGEVGELIRDESVAMRVDLTEAAALKALPYWRLVVLDEYTPEGFRMSAGLKAELMRNQRTVQRLIGRAAGDRAVGGTWTIYVEPGVSRFLPLPGTYSVLRLREVLPVQGFGLLRVLALRTEPMTMTAIQLDGVELVDQVPDAAMARLLQEARSAAAGERASERRYDPRTSLRGPRGSENEAALRRAIAEITGGRELGPLEFAERATDWLRQRHAYALSARIPAGAGRDDIVKWLESNEPGFCEYFASSLAVLCRAAGHPARVIAGYSGGKLNAFEKYIMVRNADAHAWCEVFDGQGAWMRVDPTPGAAERGAEAAARAVAQLQDSSWSARFDSLRVIWYRRVVNFDSRQQVEMVEAVKSITAESGQALRGRLEAWAKRVRAWLAGPWDLRRAGKWLGALALAGAGAWAIARLLPVLRLRWLVWRRPQDFDPIRREAGRWLAKLAQRGLAPGPEAAAGEPGLVLGDLLRLRYGHRASWPEPTGVFRRARRIRAERRN